MLSRIVLGLNTLRLITGGPWIEDDHGVLERVPDGRQ